MRMRRWCWRQQLTSSSSAMLHGSQVLHGCQSPLKCPVCHQVYLPDQGSSPKAQAGSACRHAAPFLEFTWWFGFVSSCWWWHRAGAKINDFLTLKFLPVQDGENLTFMLFWCRESWVIWWSIELAPFGKWLMFPKGRWWSRKEEKPISPLKHSSTS